MRHVKVWRLKRKPWRVNCNILDWGPKKKINLSGDSWFLQTTVQVTVRNQQISPWLSHRFREWEYIQNQNLEFKCGSSIDDTVSLLGTDLVCVSREAHPISCFPLVFLFMFSRLCFVQRNNTWVTQSPGSHWEGEKLKILGLMVLTQRSENLGEPTWM